MQAGEAPTNREPYRLGDGASVLAKVKDVMPSLTAAERRVGETILAAPVEVATMGITDMAKQSRTSPTTVTRFCRSLNLRGYADLRMALASAAGEQRARTLAERMGSDITAEDPLDLVAAKVVSTDIHTLEDTAARLDTSALAEAVQAMATADRIDLYAVRSSAALATALQLELHSLNCRAFVWQDVHSALMSAALLGPRDVSLGISHSGQTREVVEPLKVASENGATTIAVTNFPSSPLARAADLLLITAASDSPFRAPDQAARHAQLFVLDCLETGLTQRMYADPDSARAANAAAAALERAVGGHRLPADDRRRRPTPHPRAGRDRPAPGADKG